MKKFYLKGIALILSVLIYESCVKQPEKEVEIDFKAMISANAIAVSPNPLITVDGKVKGVITVVFPEKFILPEMELSLTPVVVNRDGREFTNETKLFQGEESTSKSTVLPYRKCSTINLNLDLAYTSSMANGELFVEFCIEHQDQHTSFRLKTDGKVEVIN